MLYFLLFQAQAIGHQDRFLLVFERLYLLNSAVGIVELKYLPIYTGDENLYFARFCFADMRYAVPIHQAEFIDES